MQCLSRQRQLNYLPEDQSSLTRRAPIYISQPCVKTHGFILVHWDGTAETEEKIKTETKATIRLIPLDAEEEAGKCVYSGEPSKMRVFFARAY